MTPKLILSSEGTLKYVAEWPDCNKLNLTTELCLLMSDCKCKEAIANAVPFKNKEDEERIITSLRLELRKKTKLNKYLFDDWMEPLKPYDVPENVKIIVMREVSIGKWNQFAFIKHEPKEETLSEELDLILSHTELSPKEEVESQAKNKLIKDITQKYYGARADAGDSSLSLIHDFEIWLINYMEQFRIERIK